MSNIVGTIINLKDFFSSEKISIQTSRGSDNTNMFFLESNRLYIIPDYQREIRWQKENIIELIMDLKFRDKFLGNIILSKNNSNYYLIDGQQRTTVILMLITFIRYKFGDQLDIFKTCNLINESFRGLEQLFKVNFDLTMVSKDEIINTDHYNQLNHYIDLWKYIEETNILCDQHSAESFYKNIMKSEVNIIINQEDNLGTSIECFLDVNLKGVKLDSEDIFKCYLFSKDTSGKIRESWKQLKEYSSILEEQRIKYSLMNILFQYITCDLYKYKDGIFKNFKFKEDFTLAKFEENVKYYKGEHLIQVINDKNYMQNSIGIVNKYLEIICDIACNDDQTSMFKLLFSEIDDQERKVIFKLIKIIIKDPNLIPKITLMKYIINSIILGSKSKEECRGIYTVFFFSTFFNIFENKKDRNIVYNLMKTEDWIKALVIQIKKYCSNTNLTKVQAAIQYKYTLEDSKIDERYRCKSLAALYNYFEIKNNKIIIRNINKLHEFLNNDDTYSIEHFILCNNKKNKMIIRGLPNNEYIVSKDFRKYKNSIFNFIFIDRDTNRKLDNLNIIEKISKLDGYDFKCEYSKMVFDETKSFINSNSEEINSLKSNLSKENLDDFFEDKFVKLFIDYINNIFEKIIKKFNILN